MNVTDVDQRTALMRSCLGEEGGDHTEIVQVLIDSKSDLDLQDAHKLSALHISCK